MPKSFLADEFVNQELIFDKLIPLDKRITMHLDGNSTHILDDNKGNGMKEFENINFIKTVNFEHFYDQSPASFHL